MVDFQTEKQIEDGLIYELRSITMPDGSRKYIRMMKAGWRCLETLLLVFDLETIITECQESADYHKIKFEDYFRSFVAYKYNAMYGNFNV